MKRPPLPRFARLLPSVMLATAVLLVLNGSGLVESGIALAQTVAGEAPANRDFADSDEQIATAAQADVLTGLSRRRIELDAREAQIKMQADILAATEKRLDAKIAQLKTLQDKIAALLVNRDDAQKAQIAALVKTYSAMKPVDAARIFDALPEHVVVPVAQLMKPDGLAQILAKMNAEKAKDLTIKLANKLALPELTDAGVQTAAATPVPAPAPAPVATSGATTAPAPAPKP
jgi:flagellar motility protein MotE (MotC chaperone)